METINKLILLFVISSPVIYLYLNNAYENLQFLTN